MSKFRVMALLVLATACSTGAFAGHIDINFDDQPQLGTTGVVITNQYPGVLFSSTPGDVNYVTTQAGFLSTPPNFLCSGPANSSIDCREETILTFSSPVQNLNFDGMGVNDVGVVALIDAYTNGSFNSTVQVIGNSQGNAPDHIDLTGFANVTSIRIYDITDGGGIGWDTFQYDQNSSTTPEPGTMLLLGLGVIGLAGNLRRKINL